MQRLADIAPAEVRTIWGLLSAIPDPEVPVLTITDLGMVRSVARHGYGPLPRSRVSTSTSSATPISSALSHIYAAACSDMMRA